VTRPADDLGGDPARVAPDSSGTSPDRDGGGVGPAADPVSERVAADAPVLVEEADPSGSGGTADASHRDRPRIPAWLEFPLLIGIALLVAFLLKTFIVQAFYIPSGSMENTLQVGDRVLVNKVVYHLRPIERGDIIVFDGAGIFGSDVEPAEPAGPLAAVGSFIGSFFGFTPPGESDYIKRVIGVGGDTIQTVDGKLVRNGTPVDEPYLVPGTTTTGMEQPVTVPDGQLWVMGDNRNNSSDSRVFGPIDESTVVGQAFIIM